VVPALLAIQLDVTRQLRALRHGLRARPLRGVLGTAAGLIALAFVATLGRALLAGQGVGAALGLFAGLAALVVLGAGLVAPRIARGKLRPAR